MKKALFIIIISYITPCCFGQLQLQSNSNMRIIINADNSPFPPSTYSYHTYNDIAPELAGPDVTMININMDSLAVANASPYLPLSDAIPLFYGKFVFDGPSDIHIDSGMVLSTGYVPDINNISPIFPIPGGWSGICWPAVYNSGAHYPGGGGIIAIASGGIYQIQQFPDLVAMNNGDSIADPVILEFDLVPQGNHLRIKYVFASEEYPNTDSAGYYETVCDTPNDVMAIFLSGPGIAGEKNIALIPGTNIPVGVNTITPPGMTCNETQQGYSQYYVDNTGGQNVIYNGFTTVLTAYAKVTPCDTYHLRIAVADGARHPDDSLNRYYLNGPLFSFYDSGIFLKSGSLRSTDSFHIHAYGGAAGDTTQPYAVRQCLPGGFRVYRGWAAPYPETLNYIVSGTAVAGIDYAPLSDSITIPANAQYADIPVQALNIGSGTKTLTLTLQLPTSPCATMTPMSVSATLPIYDRLFAHLLTPDTAICAGCSVLLQVTGDANLQYVWNPVTGLDAPYIQSPVATPAQTTEYVMTATAPAPITCPAVKDSVRIQIGNEGIGKLTTGQKIALSPNPFKESFKISAKPDNNAALYQIQISDISGEKILNLSGTIPELNSQLRTRTPRLPQGTYIVNIFNKDGKQMKTVKLVKIK